MKKGTPKPWSVHNRMEDCVTFVGQDGEENLFIQNVDGYFACQNEDDAKLISAAPELLEAVKMCSAVLSGEAMAKHHLISALEMARKAMIKAGA